MNGRHRRDSKHFKVRSNYTEYMHQLLKRSPLQSRRVRRHHHGDDVLEIKISLKQTKHKMRIIKLQPAVKVCNCLRLFEDVSLPLLE